MKTFKNLSIVAILLAMIVFGCKTQKDTIPQPTYKQASQKKAYEKRWNVTSVQRISQTSTVTTLIAVEFTLNTYMLYFSDDSIITGSYTETSPTTLQLDNYGTLTISSISGTSFGFVLTSGPNNLTVTSAAAPQISTSANTTALCNTWKVTKITTVPASPDDVLEPGEELYVTFSSYGTYLTKDNTSGGIEYATNTWQWTDTKQDRLCYGEWDGQNITSCNGLSNVSLSLSEGNSKLIITESITDSTDTYSTTYELEVQ